MVPGDYLALDLAVDLRRPLEAELAVYLGTRIEVRARIDRFARRDAGLAQSWSGVARRGNVLPGEGLNRECGRRPGRFVGMLGPRVGFRFLAEKRHFLPPSIPGQGFIHKRWLRLSSVAEQARGMS